MYLHPGAKLLFMGNEFAATSEWNYKTELQWNLLIWKSHQGMKACVKALNHLYCSEVALYEKQFDREGFEWVDLNHRNEAVIVFMRKGKKEEDNILVILNMTPVARWNWKIRVYGKANWSEVFNSDSKEYWGAGDVFNPTIHTDLIDKDAKVYMLTLHLPPLAAVVLK
jgi:1,4-alpha-glucan branching enzyme